MEAVYHTVVPVTRETYVLNEFEEIISECIAENGF